MIEKIYDTIKAILWSEFPKNSQDVPSVYDRTITDWLFGDRQINPSPLGVILKGTQAEVKDKGFGLREINYSIKVIFYASGDDAETSERVVNEFARIANQILKNHRTMWICDVCPFCNLSPLSPIHYIDNGVVTSVGIVTAVLPAGTNNYTISIPANGNGFKYPSYIKLSQGISGNVTVADILSCGLGINTNYYSDSYATLKLGISSGTPHTGYSTTVINNYVTNVINQVNTYWQETHGTGTYPTYLDWPGVAYQAVQQFVSDWAAGIQPSGILNNSAWTQKINSIASNYVNLMRLLQDIQIGEIIPSDDGVEKAFMHSAEFTLRAKEIISVDTFGPNNVDVNAV